MRRATFIAACTITFMVFVGSGAYLLTYRDASSRSADAFRQLRDAIEQAEAASVPAGRASFDASMEPLRLSAYRSLRERNADLVGWLRVEGAGIDLPVMQTPSDPEYYLHRDFQRAYSAHGTPFLDARCDAEASNKLIVYGHHMKDGSMFAGLMRYRSRGFREAHPTFGFDTLEGGGTYRVIAVLAVSANADSPDAIDITSPIDGAEAFDAFLRDIQARALYDTGESATYGDRLLVLATCEYSQEDGRLLVVGRRIAP